MLNDRPVWMNNDGDFYIFSWVLENGARTWRLGKNLNTGSPHMKSEDSAGNWGCPYTTDGSR